MPLEYRPRPERESWESSLVRMKARRSMLLIRTFHLERIDKYLDEDSLEKLTERP